ncbi:uncharacterized protein EAF01_011407 [Botrytis porri]|uniref:uncharacterized protein n=1 Tax=Botrytis porri TaxID=87229 RepID=UPI00190251D9|nr:uncharacterized protein EAF01_011407 [Botrytis porri]KAF7885342.1 hypothetical protein EAF01_011407 [Botrytis porri]
MAELAECPKPSFWAVFMALAEQSVWYVSIVPRRESFMSKTFIMLITDPSEFSNKEFAETVAALTIESKMSPLPFEPSQVITMVLGFMVLMQASLFSSPSNLLWLMSTVCSIFYKFILEPYITFYRLVGPGQLSYLAFETFAIFLFIAFYFLYRGSIAGLGCVVKFHQLREAQSIAGIGNISPDCQLKECTIYLSAWL